MQPCAVLAHATVSTHVATLLRHELGVREGEDVEAVHQMRVATRRLRSAFKLFDLPISADELPTELGWLADGLGAVRDLDVQMIAVKRLAAELEVQPALLAPILAWFEGQRVQKQADLGSRLDSARYAALIGALVGLVEQNPESWPGDPAELEARIGKAVRRFRKAARGVSKTSPSPALHRARIRAKQLRYSVEPVLERYSRPAERLITRATDAQDVLGGIQDSVVLEQCLRMVGQAEHELAPGSAFVAGALAQRCVHDANAARKYVRRACRRVLDVELPLGEGRLSA